VMNALGVPVTEADARSQTGRTGAEFYRAMEQKFGVTLPTDMNQRFVKRYGEVLAEGFEPMPGVLDLLRALKVPYCVATNSTRLRLDVTLAAAGLAELFAGRTFCLDDVTRGKPAPDLFLHAARTLGVAPPDAVVVEDSLHGIAAAKAAGMRALGFTGGSHCPPELADKLAAAGAEAVVKNMSELKRLLPI